MVFSLSGWRGSQGGAAQESQSGGAAARGPSPQQRRLRPHRVVVHVATVCSYGPFVDRHAPCYEGRQGITAAPSCLRQGQVRKAGVQCCKSLCVRE